MITVEQLKKLKKDDQITVTNTGEQWTVLEVIANDDFSKVTIKINNGHIDSVIHEDRLPIFDVAAAPPAKPDLPSAQEAADQLRPGFESAYKEYQEGELPKPEIEGSSVSGDTPDELKDRIEGKFTAPPELQKPARKAAKKTKKK